MRLLQGSCTSPDRAAYFVEKTRVDALAIAVGNVHLLEGGKSSLDLELIRRIADKVNIPLVLHGGTGISEESMREAIASGICKINVGTILKRVFLNEIEHYMKQGMLDSENPHEIMGKGGEKDIFSRARQAMMMRVLSFMKVFMSEGKAKE